MKGLQKLVLTQPARDKLLSLITPRHSVVHASHVTLEFGEITDHIDTFNDVKVIGYQTTSYLDVLVIAINGSYTRKFDKKILHITLSTSPGIPPVCSNDVLEEMLFQPIACIPLQVNLETVTFN